MTSHPQDKADKSIRLPEKGVGFVTIAKGICYNDKKDLLHQDGCMGGVQVLQQKVDISGCRRWNRKNNEVVKETLHICSTIIILLPTGCEPRAGKCLIESMTQARRPYWRRDVPPMSRSLPNRKLICRQPKTKKQYEADIFAKSFFLPYDCYKTGWGCCMYRTMCYASSGMKHYGTCGAWWYVVRMR